MGIWMVDYSAIVYNSFMWIRNIFFVVVVLSLQGCFLGFSPAGTPVKKWNSVPVGEGNNCPPPYNCESDKVVSVARAQLGIPYRYGGMDRSGFDCSGFVCYVYRTALGKRLPRTAEAQSTYVRMTDLSQLAPGDLLFFDTSGRGRVNHCGIYLGEGKFIHASSGRVYSVTISDLTRGFYRRTFCWGGKVPLWQQK